MSSGVISSVTNTLGRFDAAGPGGDDHRVGPPERGPNDPLVTGRGVDDDDALGAGQRVDDGALGGCLDQFHPVDRVLLEPFGGRALRVRVDEEDRLAPRAAAAAAR